MLQQAANVLATAGSIAFSPQLPRDADPVVVVTASRAPGPAAVAVAVTEVESDDIARRAAVTLLDALNDVPGVRAFSTGGVGGGSFVSVRGGEPNFTLVLLDGIKLNNPTNSRGGAFDFLAIDPSLVERIEVTRGAVSAVHGSDALSGVINIDLRSAAGAGTTLAARAQGGSGGDGGGGAAVSAGWVDGGMMIAGSWYDSGGLDQGSTLDRRQALVRVQQRAGGFALRLLGLYGDADRSLFPEDSGGPLLAVVRARETGHAELRVLGGSIRRSEGAVRPELSLSYAHQRDVTATPRIAPGVLSGVPALTDDSRFSRTEAIGDVAVERGPIAAAIGMALLRESGRSDGTIAFGFALPVRFALDRTTHSGFAEVRFRASAALSFEGAVRLDRVSGRAGVWTGRAGARYRPSARGFAVFASVGQGYKLPSLYALGHPLVGNPALRPERSTGTEAGAEWSDGGKGLLRATLFDNRFRDLIDFDPALFKTVNRDRVWTRGVEIEGRWAPAAPLRLDVSATWLAVDASASLRGRPRWQGSVRAVWRLSPGVELNGAIRANSSFGDSSIPTGQVVARGHGEGDLGVVYRPSPRWRLDATVRNVADRRYQDAVGFPAVGRQLRVSVAANL